MGFRYNRRVKLGKGVTLNVGKKGVSSASVKIGNVTLNSKGRATVKTPIKGLSYRTNLSKGRASSPRSNAYTTTTTAPKERKPFRIPLIVRILLYMMFPILLCIPVYRYLSSKNIIPSKVTGFISKNKVKLAIGFVGLFVLCGICAGGSDGSPSETTQVAVAQQQSVEQAETVQEEVQEPVEEPVVAPVEEIVEEQAVQEPVVEEVVETPVVAPVVVPAQEEPVTVQEPVSELTKEEPVVQEQVAQEAPKPVRKSFSEAQEEEQTVTKTENGGYVSKTGNKLHSVPNCGNAKNMRYIEDGSGIEKCKKCW